MEFWWWIEPLANTGCVIFVLGLFVCWIFSSFHNPFSDNNINIILWIIFISFTPLLVALLSVVIYFICYIFYVIWVPFL